MIVTLKFINRTAWDDGDWTVEMQISRDAVPQIMEWYGAFCSGDDYDVLINGRRQRLGINGELEPAVIDGRPARKAIAKSQ